MAVAPVTRGKSLQKDWFASNRAGRTVSHWVVVRWLAVGVEEDDPAAVVWFDDAAVGVCREW